MDEWNKGNVSPEESNIYQYVESLNIVNIPRFISYDINNRILTTQKIPNMSIADYYGEDFNCQPQWIIYRIRAIITCLYNNGIDYPDITGYNFIEWKNRIWIIDFGHARMDHNATDPFIMAFMDGHNGWNSNYT